MDFDLIIIGLAGVLVTAAPVVFAVIGETFAERSGIINLSLNGTIVLSAMVGFAVAVITNSLILGYLAGMLVGAVIAWIVAFSSIALHQSQVAVGFVLTLTALNLAYFLGKQYTSIQGPALPALVIPGLSQIPVIGPLLFQSDLMTYLSFLVIIAAWVYLFKTKPGLILQGIGERPAAAFVRGANVNRLRYLYTMLGGALVGLAGPIYSLGVKAGWKGTISGLDGIGWIALSITIFGGWNPARAAIGAYMFALLQWLSLVIQPILPSIPAQVLQVAPFPIMILTLLLVNIGDADWVDRTLAGLPEQTRKSLARVIRALHTSPPASLGVPFEQE
ncbi:MAG TPA: ABC transporter permease [Anaerolineaceae bacterium]|jgi:simple sugar transport system permease protein